MNAATNSTSKDNCVGTHAGVVVGRGFTFGVGVDLTHAFVLL